MPAKSKAAKTGGHALTVIINFDHTDKLSGFMKTRASNVISKTAFDIEAAAKANASGRPGPHVQTGTLRNSIRAVVDPGGLTARVAVGADYGAYVEYGTVRAPAYPYFTPAVERVRPAPGRSHIPHTPRNP